MSNTTFAERLREAMWFRKMRLMDVIDAAQPHCQELRTSLARRALCTYLAGKREPNDARMHVLARTLNVSFAWLAGANVPMAEDFMVSPALNVNEKNCLEYFRKLVPEEQASILYLMHRLVKKH